MANFFRATVHPRRTRVGRDTDRVDTTWVWVEGCDRTRRDATLRNVLCFAPFLLLLLLFQPREERERQKNERVDTLLRRLGRPTKLSCVNTRGRLKKKGSRLPTFWIHTSTCTPRGKKEVSVKKRRVGVTGWWGVRVEAVEKGRERRREKDVGKGVGGVCEIQLRKPVARERKRNGRRSEGKDVGREGRNRSLM